MDTKDEQRLSGIKNSGLQDLLNDFMKTINYPLPPMTQPSITRASAVPVTLEGIMHKLTDVETKLDGLLVALGTILELNAKAPKNEIQP